MRKEAENWFKQGLEDIDTAERLRTLKKNAEAPFYAHQACEKLLKALYIETNKDMPPKTHSLIELGKSVKVSKNVLNNLRDLNPEYVVSRYPDATYGVPSELYTQEKSRKNLRKAKEVITWIRARMSR